LSVLEHNKYDSGRPPNAGTQTPEAVEEEYGDALDALYAALRRDARRLAGA
jgi:hypothetical protein